MLQKISKFFPLTSFNRELSKSFHHPFLLRREFQRRYLTMSSHLPNSNNQLVPELEKPEEEMMKDQTNPGEIALSELSDAAEAFTEERREKPRSVKRAKYAMLLAYQGKNYYGMQIQLGPDSRNTIEGELFKAMLCTGMITEHQAKTPMDFEFQRAARTDKSVSAVRQICSLQLDRDDQGLQANGPKRLNEHLPNDIRVLAIRRATRGFNAWRKCDSRTYSYTLPTYVFASCEEITSYAYRISEERIKEVNELLTGFVGTHNFFNYTSARDHSDPSCRRHMFWFRSEQPFIYSKNEEDMEFMTLYIKGQSFMMHHIRKMIGVIIAICKNLMYKSDVQRSFEDKRLDIPKAPGLGLLLEQLHFEAYDNRFGKTHPSLNDWGPELDAEIKKLRRELIVDEILAAECESNSMMEWLSTLSFHRFHTDPEDDTEESITKLHDAKMRITEMEKEKLLLDKDGGELLLEDDVNNDDDAEEEPVEKVARLGSSSSSR